MIPYANEPAKEQEIEEVDISNLYKYEKDTHYNWYDQILLNRPLKVVIVSLLVAIVAPLLVYHFLFFRTLEQSPSDGFSSGSCVVPRASRLPCGLGNVSYEQCHPQCCYDLNSNVCFHRYPSRFSYVVLDDRVWSEEDILEPRIATVPFSSQNSIRSLRLSIDEVSPSHMSLHFYDAQMMSIVGRRIEEKNYTYNVALREMAVSVEAAQGLVFTTIRGPLIASSDIWEIAFKITNETMYGLGELPLNAGDVKVLYRRKGDFSSIPLIFAKVNESYHGLLIDSEAPTEVSVLEENQIVLRSITKSELKLHVFVGPKPSDVMIDAMNFMEVNEQLEYWMFGAHICSDSSTNSEESLADLSSFMSTAANENLPFDSHCGSMPIVFDSNCDQEDNVIEESANVVKGAGKRFVPHISPYIRYHEENETSTEFGNETSRADVGTCNIITEYEEYILHNYIQPDLNQYLYIGSIGEDKFVYPVFEKLSEEFMKRLWAFDIETDGVILENNWPLDDSPKSNDTSSHLPYFSKNFEAAFETTPEWNAAQFNETANYLHKHNLYGNDVTTAFKSVFNETPMWSSSQWMNGDVIINRQYIDASWTNLRKELVQAALGGISGHWLWSTPVCGDTDVFNHETQTSLCVKWYMAATFMPLIKIHSSTTPTHPLAFTGTNKNLMMGALKTRLTLLPYFFTTMQSGPLLRPMFYQFPTSEHLKDLNTQFSVGDDLIIVPNLLPSQTHVHFWIPPGVWYELWGGLKINGEEGDVVTLTTTDADLLTLIRGGAVILMQKDTETTAEETRLKSDFSLTIALHCQNHSTTYSHLSTSSPTCIATGSLFLTKEISIKFAANDKQLIIKAEGDDFDVICGENRKWAHAVKDINIYGLNEEYNNNDYHRQVVANTELCNLKDNLDHEIIVPFLD